MKSPHLPLGEANVKSNTFKPNGMEECEQEYLRELELSGDV